MTPSPHSARFTALLQSQLALAGLLTEHSVTAEAFTLSATDQHHIEAHLRHHSILPAALAQPFFSAIARAATLDTNDQSSIQSLLTDLHLGVTRRISAASHPALLSEMNQMLGRANQLFGTQLPMPLLIASPSPDVAYADFQLAVLVIPTAINPRNHFSRAHELAHYVRFKGLHAAHDSLCARTREEQHADALALLLTDPAQNQHFIRPAFQQWVQQGRPEPYLTPSQFKELTALRAKGFFPSLEFKDSCHTTALIPHATPESAAHAMRPPIPNP